MKKYIVCLSNLSIPAVLTLCGTDSNFIIITDQPSINEFFTGLYGSDKVIQIDKPTAAKGIKKLFEPLLLKAYKAKLLLKLQKPKNSEIYIFYNAFGVYISWWLQLIAKDNKIFYKPDIDISMWPIRYTLKSTVETFFTWLSFSSVTLPAWNGERFFPKVSEYFLKKNNIEVLPEIKIDHGYINALIRKKFKITASKFLVLTGNNVPDRLIAEDEFVKKSDELINALGTERTAVKVHPRFNYLYSKEKDCIVVPSFIPANVIMDMFEVFLGYTSSVLFEAANEGKMAISLLDYFDPISIERKETYRTYLLENLSNSANLIHFPKNIDEIKLLIGN